MKTFEQILKEVYVRRKCGMYGTDVPCFVHDVYVCGCVEEARRLMLEQTMKDL